MENRGNFSPRTGGWAKRPPCWVKHDAVDGLCVRQACKTSSSSYHPPRATVSSVYTYTLLHPFNIILSLPLLATNNYQLLQYFYYICVTFYLHGTTICTGKPHLSTFSNLLYFSDILSYSTCHHIFLAPDS